MDYFLYNCKTQGICKRAVEREQYAWEVFHDRYNTQEMCDKTVKKRPGSLKYDLVQICPNLLQNPSLSFMFLIVTYGYQKCGMRTAHILRFQELNFMMSLLKGTIATNNANHWKKGIDKELIRKPRHPHSERNVFENFAKFKGKLLSRDQFFNKLASFSLKLY